MEAARVPSNSGTDKEGAVCKHTHTHTPHTHTPHTVEHCSAINKNEIMPFAATRMDLEIIILSEGSQTETNICHHLYVESKNMIQGVRLRPR